MQPDIKRKIYDFVSSKYWPVAFLPIIEEYYTLRRAGYPAVFPKMLVQAHDPVLYHESMFTFEPCDNLISHPEKPVYQLTFLRQRGYRWRSKNRDWGTVPDLFLRNFPADDQTRYFVVIWYVISRNAYAVEGMCLE